MKKKLLNINFELMSSHIRTSSVCPDSHHNERAHLEFYFLSDLSQDKSGRAKTADW